VAARFTRAETLARLRAEIDAGRSLLMTGAGNGIAAKFIERGGADLIGVYNTGYFRMQGYGSLAGMLPIVDSNALIFRVAEREVLPQVKSTPVIAGVAGVDPLRDMERFLRSLRDIGVSGVHNFPTVAWFDGNFRRSLEATGLGYEHEIRMLNLARDLDMLTIGYAFDAADTRRLMKEAAPDIYIFHAGITGGGSTGDTDAAPLEDTAQRSERHFAIAREIKPDVILLAHGAAIIDPEHAHAMRALTRCDGVQLGSSIERMAIERPIEARTAAFKAAKPARKR
jgi:predicted TIM-barrel enzyme